MPSICHRFVASMGDGSDLEPGEHTKLHLRTSTMKLWEASPSRSSRGNASRAPVHEMAAWFSGLPSARLQSAPAAPVAATAILVL
jgi:hypothetical protein